VPLEILPTDRKGHRLIEDYHISYLATGRDFLRFGKMSRGLADALILANPNFEYGNLIPRTTIKSSKLRDRQSRDSDSIIKNFASLPDAGEIAVFYICENKHYY
jgi:hypothetical protein